MINAISRAIGLPQRAGISRRPEAQIAVLFLCVAFLHHAKAQAPMDPLIDLYHSSWTTREGAPRGITSLAQSKGGYLWIGTILGLYRFDGTDFSEFPNEPDTLPSHNITALAADNADGVWVGYDHRGISHITDHGLITDLALPKPYNGGSVDGIFCCALGSIWVLTGDTILTFQNGRWADFGALHGLPKTTYFTLFFDKSGNAWTASRHKIYLLPKGASRFQPLPEEVFSVIQFAQGANGEIWISDGWRDVRPLNSNCHAPQIPLRGTAALAFDASGNLWVAHDAGGIKRVSLSKDACAKSLGTRPFTDFNGLTSNLTRAVLTDRFGDIWVGTEMGIDRFRPRRFEPFGEQEFKFYPAIATASDGSVWIQEQGRKLQHFANGHVTEVGPKHGISPLAPDSSAGVWLLDPWTHRLEHYDRDNRKILSVTPPLKDTAAQSIVVAPSNSILVAFEGKGLWSYGKQWRRVDDRRLPGGTPTTLIRIGDTVWIGYFDNRLATWSGPSIKVYNVSDGLDVGTPLAVVSNGPIAWVAGTDGIDFLKNGRFYKLLVRKPERLRGISGIAFDKEGDLWLNTGFGAMRIRSVEIAKVLADPDYGAITSVFGSADGVIGIPAQTKPVPSLFNDSTARLWFATAGNLVTLWPALVDASHPNANLDLQEIQLNGRKVPLADLENHTLVLDGTLKNRIEFDYGAVDLDHPNHIVYRYLLEGEDKGWQMVGSSRQAIYTKLWPGTYRFRFAATNGEDRWRESTSPLVILVKPGFYQTTWFYGLCCVFALGLAWLLYQARVRYLSEQLRDRLEHRSNERLRIARELHDTLLQAIHGLMLRFHYAMDSMAADDPARPTLEIALQRADAFILEGRNKVQDLRGESDKDKPLSEMLAQIVREFSHESDAKVNITEEGFRIPLRPLVQEEFCKIGRECIVNALRHAMAERIEIDLLYKRRYFRLRCRDNGQGIPDEIIHSGGRTGHWGLRGMKERANSIGAEISFWTEDGKGTEIDVKLSGKAAYAGRNRLANLIHRLLKP